MILADFVAWIGMAFSVVVFLLLAMQKTKAPETIESVLLADRRVNSTQFGASFAAASTSLATVLIFFIGTSALYGIVLLWCGLTYLLGQVLFIYWMKKININTHDLSSNADFVLDQFRSRSAALVIAILTASAFLLILFLELYVGSEILAYYFDLTEEWRRAAAFFGLGLTVIFYVRLGGLKVVLRTDVWQFYMMIAACLALLLFAFLAPSANKTPSAQTADILWGSASAVQVALFMGWITILNLTLPFTQLSSWQRLAATTSVTEAWEGIKKSIFGFLIIWTLPVVALIILNYKGLNSTTLSELFDVLRSNGGDVTLALYPIIFVGFASALFSTADTALIALQFSLSDRSTFLLRLSKLDEKALKRTFFVSTIVIMLLLAIVYGLSEVKLGAWFIPLIYTVFSQLTIIAPQVIYAILEKSGVVNNRDFTPASAIVNVAGVVIGWLVLVGATIGVSTGLIQAPLGVQETATYVATLISAFGLLIAVFLATPAEKPQPASEHKTLGVR